MADKPVTPKDDNNDRWRWAAGDVVVKKAAQRIADGTLNVRPAPEDTPPVAGEKPKGK